MDEIKLDGEYYGNFNTYYTIEGDYMEMLCYLELTNCELKYKYKRFGSKFINIDNEDDNFEIISYSKNNIVLIDPTQIPIELKKYTFCHKLMEWFGYKF